MALNNCTEAELTALSSVSVTEETDVMADAREAEEEGLRLHGFWHRHIEGTIQPQH